MSAEVSLSEWLKMWGDQKREDLKTVHDELVSMYSHPGRYYHNLAHIEACLTEFKEVEHMLSSPFEVWLALWFHDVVYDPTRNDNEEASKEYAVQALDGLLDKGSMELVSGLIMVTKHDSLARSRDEKYIMDIDLAILGMPRDRFMEYEEGIRKEYSWVPEDSFRKGRANILKGFLERDSIYQTLHFKEKYEETARANLSYSVSILLG